jgi:hypothetical protein
MNEFKRGRTRPALATIIIIGRHVINLEQIKLKAKKLRFRQLSFTRTLPLVDPFKRIPNAVTLITDYLEGLRKQRRLQMRTGSWSSGM